MPVRQLHLADFSGHSFLPVAGEYGLDTMHQDFPPQLQPDSLRRAEIDDAHSRTSVYEEIERLVGLRNIDFKPQQSFPKLEGEFRTRRRRSLHPKECDNEKHYGTETTNHAATNAKWMPDRPLDRIQVRNEPF